MTDPNDPLPDELPEEKDEKTVTTESTSDPAVPVRLEPESEAVPELETAADPVVTPDPEPVATEEKPPIDLISGLEPHSEANPLPETSPEKEVADPNSETKPDAPPKKKDEKIDEKRNVKESRNVPKKRRAFRASRLPKLRPIRTIIILVLIIILLLWLIWHFGLGGGGGGLLPGNPEPGPSEVVEEPVAVEEEKPAIRRELNVSFFPSLTDPETAQELACNLDWTDSVSRSQESRRIVTENMDYFEFQLEKTIRSWRLSLGTGETQDIPVVSVCMTPFPGEGVFRKIESIAQRIDPKISILRLETNAPAALSE